MRLTGRADFLHCRYLAQRSGDRGGVHDADDAARPDIAPYHDRQVAVLERGRWADWLDVNVPAQSVLQPLSVNTLHVEAVA
jgi:hypothetical protein